MSIEVLDCTLRDGGYCNNWDFGFNNIKFIIKKLEMAHVDIIEIGFLSDKKTVTYENSIFKDSDKIKKILCNIKKQAKIVCMCNWGEIDFSRLESKEILGIDGIRLAFHKGDWKDAVKAAEVIKDKGYELYLQPMVTINYDDFELLELINAVNKLKPEAFYIVDSFGVVRKEDLLRMYYLVNHNLASDIKLGYHAHNNMQLAFANAASFLEINDDRNKIIDCSVFGMGRGAGNLTTELFVEHLNRYYDKSYEIAPLLQIIDNVLNKFYCESYWGYSLPQYLSSKHNCHPNYAIWLSNKNTLSTESINEILQRIPVEEKGEFNIKLLESLYLDYQNINYNDRDDILFLKEKLSGEKILLIAPGKSYKTSNMQIKKFIEEQSPIVISINFSPRDLKADIVFICNQKRYNQYIECDENKNEKIIITSNINNVKTSVYACINYHTICNDTVIVEDNAMLMILKLLTKLEIRDVYIAGMDGYSSNYEENYFDSNMQMNAEKGYERLINEGIKRELGKIKSVINCYWITQSIFSDEERNE